MQSSIPRSCAVAIAIYKAKARAQHRHLRVIARIAHAMAPGDAFFGVRNVGTLRGFVAEGFEQELAADLVYSAALEGGAVVEAAQALGDAVEREVQEGFAGIGGARAEGEGLGHAELGVEVLGGVGVDGEGAGGGVAVHADQRGGAAAYDDDVGWDGQAQQRRRGDGLCEGADVFLAVLIRAFVTNCSGAEDARGGFLRRRRSAARR